MRCSAPTASHRWRSHSIPSIPGVSMYLTARIPDKAIPLFAASVWPSICWSMPRKVSRQKEAREWFAEAHIVSVIRSLQLTQYFPLTRPYFYTAIRWAADFWPHSQMPGQWPLFEKPCWRRSHPPRLLQKQSHRHRLRFFLLKSSVQTARPIQTRATSVR